MDLGLSDNKVTSFRLFQQRIINEYENMVPEFGLTLMDGTLPILDLQKRMRTIVKKALHGWEGLSNPLAPVRRPAAKHQATAVKEVEEGEKA